MRNVNVKIEVMWLPLAYLKGVLLISFFFFKKKSVKLEFTFCFQIGNDKERIKLIGVLYLLVL